MAQSDLTLLSQVQAFSDRPGYERTSSSLWKQREDHCATLIQQAWREHYKSVLLQRISRGFDQPFMCREVASKKQGVGAGRKERPAVSNPRMQMNGKNLIEVQPSPSPEN